MNINYKRNFLVQETRTAIKRLEELKNDKSIPWWSKIPTVTMALGRLERIRMHQTDPHDILDATHCGPLSPVTTISTGGKVEKVTWEPKR